MKDLQNVLNYNKPKQFLTLLNVGVQAVEIVEGLPYVKFELSSLLWIIGVYNF